MSPPLRAFIRKNLPALETKKSALIVGAGESLNASLARKLNSAGLQITLASRTTGNLGALVGETGAPVFACDASVPADVVRLFDDVQARLGTQTW